MENYFETFSIFVERTEKGSIKILRSTKAGNSDRHVITDSSAKLMQSTFTFSWSDMGIVHPKH